MGACDDASQLHPVLQRQLRRVGLADPDAVPDARAWSQLLQRINRVYLDADNDRYTLERALDTSSREMTSLHHRLEDERDKLRGVLGALPSAVLEVDPEGVVRYHNPEAARLAGVDALVGRPLSEVFHLQDRTGIVLDSGRLLAAMAEGRLLTDADGAVLSADRIPTEAAWQTIPIGGDGERRGFVITATDLTEHKRARREATAAQVEAEVARQSERARGQFLANMSHELRTPLNAIIGYAEMLAEDWGPEDEAVASDLERILGAGRHLLGLINDVLDLSKIDAGRMDVHIDEVDLRALIDDVIASTRVLAERNRNRFVLDVPVDPGVVWTDAMRVRQCLYNLISNAAKFTSGGRITIRVRLLGPSVEIDVEDTGIGIPEEVVQRLFRPFTQADASTTRGYGGTGLGLALSRSFAEMLGGRIRIHSEVGVGSTFTLRLPMRADLSPTSASGERWTSGSGPRTVMVVDDDPTVFDLVARTLSREEIRVVGIPTAEEALAAVLEERPGAIVLDVWLPGANGWVLLRTLRSLPETAKIPVIVVTTDDGRRDAERFRADAFLQKPLDRIRLADLILDMLSR